MKLTMKYKLEPIQVLGKLDVVDIGVKNYTREIYIDDKLVPPALADIILLGINVASKQHLDMIDRLIKEGM